MSLMDYNVYEGISRHDFIDMAFCGFEADRKVGKFDYPPAWFRAYDRQRQKEYDYTRLVNTEFNKVAELVDQDIIDMMDALRI